MDWSKGPIKLVMCTVCRPAAQEENVALGTDPDPRNRNRSSLQLVPPRSFTTAAIQLRSQEASQVRAFTNQWKDRARAQLTNEYGKDCSRYLYDDPLLWMSREPRSING